ncbi:MAG: TonB-dependent receptor [Proteobacteria bacterium]|nr:TonB-dependent receptor [Pseudomonadota bacterium]
MHHRTPRFSALAIGIAGVLASAQAAAAETQLEEIVITARQREERIEDVPVTVQAFTETTIESAGIERPSDFIALTPGVAQVQTAEAGDLQVVIRGINTGRDAETNFALVVDGVLQTNPNALNAELNGVTQIEVLKGPQGALYGRNALAGALIVTTRKPGDEFEADVGAGYATDDTYKANLWLGGPIGGSARGSFTAYTRHTDGQWKNDLLGCDDCVDFFEETGASGRLMFDVGGGSVDVKGRVSKVESGAINFNAAVAFAEAAAIFGAPVYDQDPNQSTFFYTNNVIPQNEQENLNLSAKGDWDVGVGTLTGIVAYNDQTNFFLTDGASDAYYLYAFTDSCAESFAARTADTPLPPPFNYGNPPGTILSFASYSSSFQPPYGPTTCGGYQYQQRDQEDMSVELRLTSPGDQVLRWLVGAYFADIDRHVVVSQGGDQTGASLAQDFDTKAFVPTSGPNPTDLLYDDDFTSQVYAGFGQVAYDLREGLELSLAVRYDTEKRDVDNNVPTCDSPDDTSGPCRPQTPGFGALYVLLGQPQPYINPAYAQVPEYAASGIPSRSKTFSQFQPKLSVNWKVTDEVALYTSYGYGFRSGGFNSSGSAATIEQYYGNLCLGPSTAYNVDLDGDGTGEFTLPLNLPACTNESVRNLTGIETDDYNKEVSKAFEIGFKSTLLDGTLSLNGAVYHTDVEDAQFFNFMAGPFGLLRVVTNLDEVTIRGAELDFHWNATDMLSIYGGWGWTDGEIDKYSDRPYTNGNKLPYAPEYTGNLGAELVVPVGGSGLEFVGRVDASFVGETWFHPVQDETVPNLATSFGFGQGNYGKMKRDPYSVINARLGLRAEQWTVTAWGRNIADEDYLQEVIVAPEFGGSFIHDSPGSSYGLDVSYSFR